MKYETQIAITNAVFALARELSRDDHDAFMAMLDKRPYERRTTAIIEGHLSAILALADGANRVRAAMATTDREQAMDGAVAAVAAEIEGGN